ncbi:hypothetical protein BaRGS_00023985 [Batillaria attramentaria]|uniref:Uncharacterized protein n=1 Tax=Batillaria attramentaria TaxID=370345 RepID=A0ABD0KCC2_9CAEN
MDENTLSDFLQRMEKTMQDQIKQQEKEVDSLEGFSGRNNLKFIGIRESAKQNDTACAQTLVDVLNQHSTRRTWTIDDVERTHRVGPRKGNSQQPRPLIVRFSRWPDKMAVVQGADLKQNLKDSGIKVAADLTKRQRAEIERVRSEGKFGYYKNGRLHVEDRRTPWYEQDPRERPDQRPSLDEEDERDAGDRQQQGAMLASSHSNDDRDDDDHSSQPPRHLRDAPSPT